jgi:hypothetical protein
MSRNTVKPRVVPSGSMQLTQVGATAIYTAPAPETLAFLLFGSAAPPQTLPLADTWATTGTPPAPGYYLFLAKPPASMSPTSLEKQLRDALPKATPAATGCVWADNSQNPITVVQQLPLALDTKSKQPIVPQDVQLNLPEGLIPVGFSGGTAVFASIDNGAPNALLFSRPTMPGTDTPRPGGVTLSLLGPNTRLLTFTGLMSIQPAGPDQAVKNLIAATVDLLDPFGPNNKILQQTIILSKDTTGYRIAAG